MSPPIDFQDLSKEEAPISTEVGSELHEKCVEVMQDIGMLFQSLQRRGEEDRVIEAALYNYAARAAIEISEMTKERFLEFMASCYDLYAKTRAS